MFLVKSVCASQTPSVPHSENQLINRIIDPVLMHMFVYLHEEGSFSATAERMHLTQQAVSAQLKRLEEMTGRTLVQRCHQRIALTRDGEALLISARQVVEISQRIRHQFSSVPLDGLIRFGVTPGIGPSLLFPLLSELRRAHPRLEVRCQTTHSSQLLAKLDAGSLDVIVGAQRDGDANGEVLRRERLVWVGDVENLVRTGSAVPLVMLPSPTFLREHIFSSLGNAGFKWTVHSECDDSVSLRVAIQAGWGITLFNEEMILAEPSFPHDRGSGLLPDPGHVEFFMRFNAAGRNPSIDPFVGILRSTLSLQQ